MTHVSLIEGAPSRPTGSPVLAAWWSVGLHTLKPGTSDRAKAQPSHFLAVKFQTSLGILFKLHLPRRFGDIKSHTSVSPSSPTPVLSVMWFYGCSHFWVACVSPTLDLS